jgi:excinuclease UvrABC ATPase subunit
VASTRQPFGIQIGCLVRRRGWHRSASTPRVGSCDGTGGRRPRPTAGRFDQIRRLFAGTPYARRRWKPGHFSFNTREGQCPTCRRLGHIDLDVQYLPGATIIVIDHDLDLLAAADHLIDMGPGGGPDGGHILAAGAPEDVARDSASVTGPWLAEHLGAAAARSG